MFFTFIYCKRERKHMLDEFAIIQRDDKQSVHMCGALDLRFAVTSTPKKATSSSARSIAEKADLEQPIIVTPFIFDRSVVAPKARFNSSSLWSICR